MTFVPEQLLSFSYLSSWSGLPDEPANYLQVTYEVRDLAGATQLTITQSNYNEEKAQHSVGNWEIVVNGLKQLVEV
ncbi:hypothetical protein CK934_16910 [Chitinophaga sp. MD30]|nr:hypothetical protein CK934_16910 [Chitinophaga sp. MD30]